MGAWDFPSNGETVTVRTVLWGLAGICIACLVVGFVFGHWVF
jgi:hypothetical protein